MVSALINSEVFTGSESDSKSGLNYLNASEGGEASVADRQHRPVLHCCCKIEIGIGIILLQALAVSNTLWSRVNELVWMPV